MFIVRNFSCILVMKALFYPKCIQTVESLRSDVL